MSTAHPVIQVVKVVALPRLQLLLELLVDSRRLMVTSSAAVLVREVDRVDEERIVRVLRSSHFLARCTLLWQMLLAWRQVCL